MTEDKNNSFWDQYYTKVCNFLKNTSVYELIKSRNRKAWLETYKNWWQLFYNLITDDGERALVVGVAGGVLIVVLFKQILFLIALCAIPGLLFWLIADNVDSETEKPSPNPHELVAAEAEILTNVDQEVEEEPKKKTSTRKKTSTKKATAKSKSSRKKQE